MTAVDLRLRPGWDKDVVNRWLSYHGEISLALTKQRTALESALIPVTPYILISAIECYRRHPELMTEIAAAIDPAEIGAAGRRLGNQVDTVHLWSIANIYLLGRKMLAQAEMLDFEADLLRTGTVLGFWEAAAAAFRADGTHQAADADGVVTPYADHAAEFTAGCVVLADDAQRRRATRLNALLTSYLFLLYFDTRAGYQDTGPYLLPDGRVMLLRAFSKFGPSDFPWSRDVAAGLPFSTVVGAFVLDGVRLRVTDWGTSVTEPEDYLPHVQAFGLFDTANGSVVPIADTDADALAAGAKDAQRSLYRRIAAMDKREKIDAGAYVYFSFLRPFAEIAGIADDLDWTVPRASLDLYPLLELIERTPEIADDGSPYYPPIP